MIYEYAMFAEYICQQCLKIERVLLWKLSLILLVVEKVGYRGRSCFKRRATFAIFKNIHLHSKAFLKNRTINQIEGKQRPR
jgi:hypothetical protein